MSFTHFKSARALVLATFVLILASPSAHARRGGGGGGGQDQYLLSTAGGIAAPSATSGVLGENPAGLANNGQATFLGLVGSATDDFDPLGYGGGFFIGNGAAGAGLTLQGATGTSALALNWGLAADISALNFSWGFTGSHIINSGSTGIASSMGLDTGIIFNPKAQGRVGVTLYDLVDGINAVGAGWAYDVNASATFAVDGVYNLVSEGTVIKPGLALHLQGFHITSGYGFDISNGGGYRLPTGFSLGLGIPLGRTLAIQGYYNQLAHYYAGLTIAL